MSREVNNGGWDQFFRNSSGALALDLVPTLEAMGSKENLSIARRALKRFGEPASLSENENPWEDLEAMTLKFIAKNPAEFSP